MRTSQLPYSEKLDHIRFLAAFMVLMFHVEIFTRRPGGWSVPMISEGHVGVAVFMVISGMLLAMITYEKRISVGQFYVNRALRIYPLFLCVVALGYFSAPDPRPTSTGVDFLMAMLPISNLYREVYGPFGGVFWSVAVELQFYLLFPAVIWAVEKHGERCLVSLVALLVIVRTILYALNGTVHQAAYFSLFGCLDMFLAGIVAGRLYMRSKISIPGWAPIVGLIALNLLLWIAFRGSFYHVGGYGGASPSPLWIIWPTVQAVFFAALVFAYLRAPLLLPFSAQIATLGKYSYSIYAWHVLVLMTVIKLFPSGGWHPYIIGLFVAVLTIGFSAISYHVIERPFLDWRRTYTTPWPREIANREHPAA